MRLVILAAVLGSFAGCRATRAPDLRPGLPRPAHIPERARVLISDQMRRHAEDMSALLWATLFVDYGSAAEFAAAIETEPRFSRPLDPTSDDINTLLPARFFEAQDAIVERARDVRRAAEASDPDALQSSYAALAATCVSCHAAYLEDPKEGR